MKKTESPSDKDFKEFVKSQVRLLSIMAVDGKDTLRCKLMETGLLLVRFTPKQRKKLVKLIMKQAVPLMTGHIDASIDNAHYTFWLATEGYRKQLEAVTGRVSKLKGKKQ